ncbi:SPOR domain-containing protein [Melioribacter sp. OK-6-Me]|uniref:SPOR domain-containing protein n=1 Tax=unclassified Melioribacter TaxID=2627329 RepID=UPI003ED8B780
MKISFIIITIFILLFGCSSLRKTQNEQPEEKVYIFDELETLDEVSKTDTLNNENKIEEIPSDEVKKKTIHFIVQVAAFSNRINAEKFVEMNSSKTDYELNIIYKDEVKMYTVQLFPFDSIEKAEKVRDELKKVSEFKNTFIFTIED